ncbi:helix-turn-helix domain-containing protein [Aquimarina sp. RZ0]|uniref:helix-turn-helix domain-containing protein n=1 Tax=Aquimarina sp. RZ0 TaxID=2607730 RepID=UPI0011F0A5C9|nr:helix-turn-helix transcriptional regulator [Aquimarina sp. RZ0]KAA1246525.1 helix-turn-helix transcriptional regulator [Aquimarina sp. RZ0]
MKFAERLQELRKKNKFSQEELAKQVDIHVNVLGRYERGDSNPSIEVATKLADALTVSLDYLVGKTELLVDESITNKILTIQKLPEKDREHILFALDAMIRDAKARLAYS